MSVHGRALDVLVRAIALPWIALAGADALAADDSATQDPFDNATYCLRVQGTATDAAGRLRLAAPPVDPANPTAFVQGTYSRLGGDAMAGKAATAPSAAAPFLRSVFGAPPPLIKLLFDGSADLQAGRHADAERQFADCVTLAQAQGDGLTEAACHNNLGVADAATGKYAQARSELERALSLYETPRAASSGASSPAPANPLMAALGGLLKHLPPEQRAQLDSTIRDRQGAMADQARALNQRRGTEIASLNLANLALASGRLADAQRHAQHAVDSHLAQEPASCRAAAAMDLARVDARLDKRTEGLALLAAWPPARRRADEGDVDMVELGSIALAGAGAGDPGAGTAEAPPQRDAGDAVRATVGGQSALAEPTDRIGDVALTQAFAQAARARDAGVPAAQALAEWQRLALRADAGQRPDLAFVARAALMRLHAQQGEAAQAIYDGKRAANLAQAARADLSDATPSRDARRAFLRERHQAYVALAQALLDARRLQEAESVLQLLKEDEGQQFIDHPAAVNLLALTAGEQARQRRDDDFARRLQESERARLAAAEVPIIGGNALRTLSRPQIESLRLKLGLSLASLPARLRDHPFRSPGNDPTGRAAVQEMRAFLLGPQRLEPFMQHLVEDAPRFDPPPSADERSRLADTLAHLARIQADLQPLLDASAPARGGFGLTLRRAGSPSPREQSSSPLDYVGAEPMERVWRNLRDADAIEANLVRLGADAIATVPAIAPATDDTVALMARQALPTDLLYYLSGERRLDILLVSAAGRRHVQVAQSRAELDASVKAFVALLKDSRSDPRPAARAMYQRLFAPIAPAVSDSGARLLAFSFDGNLRFMPVAALNDGSHWLVERYAIALHPGGTLAGRLTPASAGWRVAAFGATLGGRIGTDTFGTLPNVRGEIDAVVRRDAGARGALPGNAWLNEDFTAQRLKTALSEGTPVLHIASHFKFAEGDASRSYLLLGDGGALSLRDLAGPGYRFDRTELVTLSACETGVSSDDGYDQEVDGLAALLMGQGAPSVLASLWKVNDQSTATLMASLYRQHEEQHASRALALQRAQQAMILAAAPSPMPSEGFTRSVSPLGSPAAPEPTAGLSTASLGYGHPFFWAPFVLMGDWL